MCMEENTSKPNVTELISNHKRSEGSTQTILFFLEYLLSRTPCMIFFSYFDLKIVNFFYSICNLSLLANEDEKAFSFLEP